MSTDTITPPVNDEVAIATSIVKLYEEAEIATGGNSPSTTPLYDLVNTYGLVIVEIPNLTYEVAQAYLSDEIGDKVDIPATNQALSGFLYLQVIDSNEPPTGYILIEKRDIIVRKRFTVAHELGHYMLHFRNQDLEKGDRYIEGLEYSSDIDIEGEVTFSQIAFSRGEQLNSFDPEIIKRVEREANQFAAELLMPYDSCLKLISELQPQFGTKRSILTRYLSSKFLVSYQAMFIRLSNLGLGEE